MEFYVQPSQFFTYALRYSFIEGGLITVIDRKHPNDSFIV